MALLSRFSADRDTLLRCAETLLIAATGGLTLGLLHFPAGFLSGAIILVSIAALSGRPVLVPTSLARLVYLCVGMSLGGAVTPQTLHGLSSWPVSMAILTLAMIAVTIAVMAYLRHVHGWDANSALLGSFPGGLATVMVLAVENGADVRAVAVVQTVRVAVLATVLPITLSMLGMVGDPTALVRPQNFAHPGELALLLGVSTLAALAAVRIRFPGGLMFGAMIASAILHGSGMVSVGLPQWITSASFIVLGAVTGARFANTDVRLLRHLAAAAAGALLVGTSVALAFALLAAALTSMATGSLILAYAPGALDAMMILALALHYDPAFVGAHHLARFFMVLLTMPLIVKFMQRVRARKASGSET